MQRLSGEFNRGYRKAIQDIEDVFDYIQEDLRYHHKALTGKLARELLTCIMINREKIRDDWGGFIRWNHQLDNFEWFKKEEREIEMRYIWARLGVVMNITEEEEQRILGSGDPHEAASAVLEILYERRFTADGDTYIPHEVVADYNEKYGTSYPEKTVEMCL